jgi:hypothetical protein
MHSSLTNRRAPVDTLRRRLSLAPPLALVAGCATPLVTPIPRGGELGLVFASAPAGKTTAIDNLSLGSDARTGAGTGMLAGGLSGLSCGPFALLCVPAGLLVGALVGWGGGAVVGVTGVLDEGKARGVRERLSAVLRSHDLLAELREQITLRAGRLWTLTAPAPAHVLRVQLQDVGLTSTRSEFIGLVVHVQTALERDRGGQREALGDKVFEFAPAASPLAVWLDEGSDFVDTLFAGCVQQLASQIVAEYGRS